MFRGAVLRKVPRELTLFHNHQGEGFRYSYPLIQYKSIGGKAALFCLGEGTEAIGHFFLNKDLEITIRDRHETLSVKNVYASRCLLQTWQSSFTYSTRFWLPLNSKNYHTYNKCESLVEKLGMLESILKGNILSMGKGLDCFFQEEIKCSIISLDNPGCYVFKGVKLRGFDIIWKSNVYIPDYIGIGKGASFGFGITKEINKTNENKKEQ